MNDSGVRGCSRPRVYYVLGAVALVAALTVVALVLTRVAPVRGQGWGARPPEGWGARPPEAVVDLSVEPSMARGPADAPVTIIEFSDYQ